MKPKQEGKDPAVCPPGAPPRAGKSGEGARSALEHLIEQERQRQATRSDSPTPQPGAEPATPARPR